MVALANNAEGGSEDAAVTTGNSGGTSGNAWDAVSVGGSGTITYDNEHARGTRAYKIVGDSGNNTVMGWVASLGTVGELYGRAYLYLTSNPAANLTFTWVRNGTSQVARLRINTSGLIEITNAANTVIATAGTAIATGQWIRVEWHVIALASNGTAEARLFNSADSTTATSTFGSTTATLLNNLTRVDFGRVANASPETHWEDDIRVDTAGWIGPTAVSASGTGTITGAAALTGSGAKATAGTAAITGASALTAAGDGEFPTFPESPLDARVEILVDGEWTDITSDVRLDERITITRGRRDEASRVDRSTARLKLANTGGKYSPRNPLSEYYGLIGRNTLLRNSVPYGESYLSLPGGAGDLASCPDAAGLTFSGDLDVGVEVDTLWWMRTQDLIGQYESTGDQRGWALIVGAGGFLNLAWSPDGTLPSRLLVESTAPVPAPSGRLAVRAALDVDDGFGGHVVTFFTASSLSGSWEQLGDPVTGAGTTSVHNSTGAVELGNVADLTASAVTGRIFGVEVRGGGSLIADPDFTGLAAGATGVTDSAGNVWTLAGEAVIDDRDYRFYGEVPGWPPVPDLSETDVVVPLEASGILRRLDQGASPLRSALYRDLTHPSRTAIVAYWPAEDGSGATQVASALPNHPPMAIVGTPNMAAFSDYAASGPLPTMGTARFAATVPAYTPTGETTVRVVGHIPDGGVSTSQRVMTVRTTGSARTWSVWLRSDGDMALQAWDDEGTSILNTGYLPHDANGFNVGIVLELTQSGGNIGWRLVVHDLTNISPTSILNLGDDSGTLNGHTFGRASAITLGEDRGLGDVALGHLVVGNDTSAFTGSGPSLRAWVGETAGNRFARLCAEEDIAHWIIGDPDDTETMGPQRVVPLRTLLEDCAAADFGILYEPRDTLGLALRTRVSLYNQTAVLALSKPAGHLAAPLLPKPDDQLTRNDFTAQRDGGSSYRAVVEDGPLSVQPPPAGVGRYDESLSFNVQGDGQLQHIAGWRVHLGTWDEERHTQIVVSLGTGAFVADPALTAAALAIDIGDRLTIDGLSGWAAPDLVDQLTQGFVETQHSYEHTIAANTTPGGPWRVAICDADRYDTAGSELASGVDADDTALSVATTSGPIWTEDADDLPFDIVCGGERMTVTAISGSSSPQSFTVTRSVNGITKAHSAGAALSLADPVVYAL